MDLPAPPTLESLLRLGTDDASRAFSRWLDRPARISFKECARLPLEAAGGMLGLADAPICAAAMSVSGGLGGLLLVACEEPAGLALCDAILGRPGGSATAWGEIERSGLLETANIIGCAYLNGIAAAVRGGTGGIVPSPPVFLQDFAAALVDGVLLERPVSRETVVVARTEFEVDATPIRCALVFVPDADSLRDIETGPGPGCPAP